MASSADIASLLAGITGGNDEPSTVTQFLSVGFPPLNHALTHSYDGGLPVGRCVEIYGPESSGKTALATMAMKAAQDMGGFAGFSDHERSFEFDQAESIGLNTKGAFVYKKPKTFEESIALCVSVCSQVRKAKVIPDDAPIAWVFDSLATMVPDSAYYDQKTGKEKTPDQRSMHDNTALARATSAHFPAFVQHCEELGICAIFLNQIRMNIGVVYGNPETTPGGKSPKFFFTQRISLSSQKITKGSGADAEVLGSIIKAKVIKNKVSRPFETAEYRFEFQEDGSGKFAVARSLIDFLVKEKALKQSGAYIEWIDGKKFYAGPLAEKIEKEGLMGELIKLLPPEYVAPTMEVEDEEEAA